MDAGTWGWHIYFGERGGTERRRSGEWDWLRVYLDSGKGAKARERERRGFNSTFVEVADAVC